MAHENHSNQSLDDRKKVFISYAWSSKDWVLDFATKLMGTYGIEVVIDEWNTQPGDDLNKFMEREVNDDSIDKVLMVCDETYKSKANTRSGGAGTEAQILSPQLYADNAPGKYIPIVNMLDDQQQAYLPTFLSSRKYIDFSDPTKDAEKFSELVEAIYNQSNYERPELGPIPTKILNHESNYYPLRQIALKVKSNIENPRLLASLFQNDFLDQLESSMKQCEIKIGSKDNDVIYEQILQSLDDFNDAEVLFKECLEKYLRSGESDAAYLAEFFSNVNDYINDLTSSEDKRKDPIRFLLHEQFLIVIGELIKQRKWSSIRYLVMFRYKNGAHHKAAFGCLQNPPLSIYDYNDKHDHKMNIVGTMFENRNGDIFNQMWCADVLLFYIRKLQIHNDSMAFYTWYPNIQVRTIYPTRVDFPLLENLEIDENMNAFLLMANLTEKELKSSEVYNKYSSFQSMTVASRILCK